VSAVRFLIASSRDATIEKWLTGLSGLDNVEFRVGSGGAVGSGCDAAVLPFYLAHDRYGGVPEIGRAQVLRNSLGDGLPGYIVATPPFQAQERVPDEAELAERVYFTVRESLDAISRYNSTGGHPPIDRVLLNVDGLGFDRFGEELSMMAVRRALGSDEA
jgi:hypothetical protein